MTLRGRGWPVIDGGRRGHVVVVAGPDVRLEGFVIRGSALAYSSEAAGVVVEGPRAVVRGNRIDDVLFGLYLAGATDAVIEHNTIATADLPLERRGHAVYLWRARGVHLRHNHIVRGKDGFYFAFSEDTLVADNAVTGCRYGIHYMYSHRNAFVANTFVDNAVGAAVMYSTDVRLEGNTFEGSRSAAVGVGLILKDADRVLVRDNRIARNATGIEVENAPPTPDGWVRLEGNVVAFNTVGLSLMSTAALTATGNAFVENLRPLEPRGALRPEANTWAEGRRGNYWSDYAGFDADGDGIGDVPYRHTDVLEDLAVRAPVLRALLFTPAHHALETAARLAPLVQGNDPEPVAEGQGHEVPGVGCLGEAVEQQHIRLSRLAPLQVVQPHFACVHVAAARLHLLLERYAHGPGSVKEVAHWAPPRQLHALQAEVIWVPISAPLARPVNRLRLQLTPEFL